MKNLHSLLPFLLVSAVLILAAAGCSGGTSGQGKLPGAPAPDKTDGTCGENLTWTYDLKSKTLEISGTGPMVTPERFMWSNYTIKKLLISEGVTSIADHAFYSNGALSGSLELPSTMEKIGAFAFYGCSGITGELNLPDAVAEIGDYAFERCTGLTALHPSKGLKRIGDEAFQNCSSIASQLEFSEELEFIGRSAFYHCEALHGDLLLPDSLTSMGSYAFAGCGFDGKLRLSAGLSEIPYNAFS